MAGKFEIYRDKKGEFRFRLKAGNGETILASEGYGDRAGVDGGVASVRKNGGEFARFVKNVATNGKHHFVLRSANNQVIGQSEMYESEDACDAGIKSVMANAPVAAIDDQTA